MGSAFFISLIVVQFYVLTQPIIFVFWLFASAYLAMKKGDNESANDENISTQLSFPQLL